VPSVESSYSFSEALQQDWEWSDRYATQPELLRYANHVADRFDLRRDIQFNTRIVSAVFDESAKIWVVTTAGGETARARFCVMATGCLSSARTPAIEGLASFEGKVHHTGAWPHDGVDFGGQRVGVIGTGSSGIQSIPLIARQAAHLTVFQRTPNFCVPARNAALSAEFKADVKEHYPQLREKIRQGALNVHTYGARSALDVTEAQRNTEYEARWTVGGFHFIKAFPDLMVNIEANRTAAEFVFRKIRETVSDPAVAEMLLPRDHPIGTKRMCVGTDYYETYNRSNVRLVNLREAPIEAITPRGLRAGGEEHALDAIVFATGFDAMTGALLAIDIRGRGGLALRDAWAGGPRSYLGIAVPGFPNLFTITGPGSPSVLTNMIMSIEQHVDWVIDCIVHLDSCGHATIEARRDASDQWVEHVNDVADKTLFPAADSWYVGANVPGKPRVFMPYVGDPWTYRQTCRQVAADGYPGFELAAAAAHTATIR
ncbi:MAG: NAD(P)/FAD-dependent oxidoreductase, partial [Afipia sp.]|nr:NAD(P)/FAD-dependent oxidoreductase [Afipia sp.]